MNRNLAPASCGLVVLLLTSACGPLGERFFDAIGGDTTEVDGASTPSDTGAATDASLADLEPPPPTEARATAEGTCAHWRTERSVRYEGQWFGSVAACDAGTPDPVSGENALRQLNLFRWLARLPPARLDGATSELAQSCALMMAAANALEHFPSDDWPCYSADGALAAQNSNLSPTPAVAAIDLYLLDPGNETTLGHRRWLLANDLDAVGSGSTTTHSCLWVVPSEGSAPNAAASWTAWPPPGSFPVEANTLTGFWTLDETGWSLQSDTIDLRDAEVTITDQTGASLPVDVVPLEPGFGSQSAIGMLPRGWGMQAGQSYTVAVEGVAEPIVYTIDVVTCE